MVDLNFFNASSPHWWVFKKPFIGFRAWVLFRRTLKEGLFQGFGLIQIGARYLLYIGQDPDGLLLCVGFVWLSNNTPWQKSS